MRGQKKSWSHYIGNRQSPLHAYKKWSFLKPAAQWRTCSAHRLFVTSWIDKVSECAGNFYGYFCHSWQINQISNMIDIFCQEWQKILVCGGQMCATNKIVNFKEFPVKYLTFTEFFKILCVEIRMTPCAYILKSRCFP